MSDNKKQKNQKISNVDQLERMTSDSVSFDEELDLFGEHKTREQIRAEERQRKKEERAALRREMKKRRETKEKSTPAKRKDILAVGAVLLAIILLCGLALGNSLLRGNQSRAWEIDESRGYILKTDAYPELVAEGPKADVLEVYFTENDHMYLELILGNGTEKPVKINSVDVQVYNDETDELIAAGKVIVEEDVTVLVQDIAYYEFYISPEHIFVDNTTSLPEVCSFVIEIDGTPVVTE